MLLDVAANAELPLNNRSNNNNQDDKSCPPLLMGLGIFGALYCVGFVAYLVYALLEREPSCRVAGLLCNQNETECITVESIINCTTQAILDVSPNTTVNATHCNSQHLLLAPAINHNNTYSFTEGNECHATLTLQGKRL